MLLMLSDGSDDFFQKNLNGTLSRVSIGMDTDQGQHFVGPDLGPISLQRL